MNYSIEEIEKCILILKSLVDDSTQLVKLSSEQRIALLKVSGELSRPDRQEIKKRNKIAKKIQALENFEKNRRARDTTGIRKARLDSVYKVPKQIETQISACGDKSEQLDSPRNCYVCKEEYTTLHFFYDSMCKKCGDFNYGKRFQTTSLQEKIAIITGARMKIGFQATLLLLRAGATVIATTRFPVDATIRFSKEEDFAEWAGRLHIYGLDLRHIPSVELFTSYVEQRYGRLDILINNAAQTVRRPPGFYAHLIENEKNPHSALTKENEKLLFDYYGCRNALNSSRNHTIDKESVLSIKWNDKDPGIGLREPAMLSQIAYSYDNAIADNEIFPKGNFDVDLQQVDLRETNSWRLRLGEIQTSEMLELQLVNAVAPFVLCNRMVSLMKHDYTGKKHIINVTAMEGKFFRFKKESRHPHTNMAKAALNMLTHTSSEDLSKDGIYMNAVDTGWVTDEDPFELSQFKQKIHDFQPPLDIVDGAARVCDPFFDGILTGKHWVGKFLKDYFPIDW